MDSRDKRFLVILGLLCIALLGSTTALVRACTMPCKGVCHPLFGWCLKNSDGTIAHYQYYQVVTWTPKDPGTPWCTDASNLGNPAVFQNVLYDKYTACTTDCPADYTSYWSSAASVGKPSILRATAQRKTQCNPGSSP